MITDFWAAGVLFSIVVFAVKAGLVAGSINMKTRWIIGLAMLYGVISLVIGVILKMLIPLDYFEFFRKYMAPGVIVHLLLSIGLIAWGLFTMQRSIREKDGPHSGAGYFLMLPCPVCMFVMLLSCSVFSALTGIDPIKAGAIMGAVFIILIPVTALYAAHLVRQGRKSGNSHLLLGFILAMTGLYFAVSIIVIPVYSRVKALLATGTMVRGEDVSPVKMVGLVAVVLIVVLWGFIGNHKKYKKNKK